MKLSKKGLERTSEPILKFVDGYYDYAIVETLEDQEFEQDDFQDVIILTVEEASEVWDSLVNLVSYVESIDGGMSVLVRDGQRNIDLIRNRIKKSGG